MENASQSKSNFKIVQIREYQTPPPPPTRDPPNNMSYLAPIWSPRHARDLSLPRALVRLNLT